MNDNSRRAFLQLLGGGALAAFAAPVRKILARPLPLSTEGATPIVHSTFVMGQVATITAYGAEIALVRQAITEAFDELRRVDALMSVFDAQSELSRINGAAARAALAVHRSTLECVCAAVRFASLSGDAFDPTLEPLMRVWGFHAKRTAMPTDKEIADALDAVGVKNIKIEGNAIGLAKPGAAIDLGSIAVGFAIDKAAAALKRRGVESALINVSGDIYAIGAPPGKPGWRIGIVNPLHAERIITRRTICDEALSTAGNYENFVIYNAVKYGHVLDPQNGYPPHRLASATVIAPTSTVADALSTAAFVNPALAIPDGKIIRVSNADAVETAG